MRFSQAVVSKASPRTGSEENLRPESRKASRRPTVATVDIWSGRRFVGKGTATNLSGDGAFIKSDSKLDVGSKLQLKLALPTHQEAVHVSGKAVRYGPNGIGVKFEDISARDRGRLRNYSGYYETDEAIVRIQRSLGDLVPGNLLPMSNEEEILSILESAQKKQSEVLVVPSGKGFRRLRSRIADILPADKNDLLKRPTAIISDITSPLRPDIRMVYLAFSVGPLYYMCEALVHTCWPELKIFIPERIYISERRSQSRSLEVERWLEFTGSGFDGGKGRASVVDLASTGASIRLPESAMWMPGMKLPGFYIIGADEREPVPGAIVKYIRKSTTGFLRVGLQFEDHYRRGGSRSVPKFRPVDTSALSAVRRSLSYLRGKLSALVRGRKGIDQESVEIVRYKNKRGDSVAGIIDANFDTSDPSEQPDIAIVIAPAILKRKEVFGLFARTLVDNIDREDRRVVVLRFDATHIVGESAMDRELEEAGRPYYRWTFSHLRDDIEASLKYLERRFRPKKRVLVSVSLSAIPARKVVLDGSSPEVDLWIAPFGCPDAQDVIRNYMAGLDLFPLVERGEAPESVMIHGRPMQCATLYGHAVAERMAYLEDACSDMSGIGAPVCWILGRHDHWVTNSRVRKMLDAPGGGIREIFELPTGHVLKSGPEAIELFKLVSETVLKQLFNIDRPGLEPVMSKFVAQSEAEWSRIKKQRLNDCEDFWQEHLFGERGEEDIYDVMLNHPEYTRFLSRQVELLDPRSQEDIADLGCGTGNLSMEILRSFGPHRSPNSLTYVDLVPKAVDFTKRKVTAGLKEGITRNFAHRGQVVDLEVSRLSIVNSFLEGKLWSVQELAGRIEGFQLSTARKLRAAYGSALHAVLRGKPSKTTEVHRLVPDLTQEEIQVVLEISRVSRYLQDRTLEDDLRPGVFSASSTADLKLETLFFGASTRDLSLPLPTEGYDKVGASLLLPYLYDPKTFLSEMLRILRPGGLLVASSIVPNFDPSKTYLEAARILSRSEAENAEEKLAALRAFGSMVGRLIELEEEGRFRFRSGQELCNLAEEAGFSNVSVFPAFGSPPTALILRAQR